MVFYSKRPEPMSQSFSVPETYSPPYESFTIAFVDFKSMKNADADTSLDNCKVFDGNYKII